MRPLALLLAVCATMVMGCAQSDPAANTTAQAPPSPMKVASAPRASISDLFHTNPDAYLHELLSLEQEIRVSRFDAALVRWRPVRSLADDLVRSQSNSPQAKAYLDRVARVRERMDMLAGIAVERESARAQAAVTDVDMLKYLQLRDGMSYREAADALGREGVETSRSHIADLTTIGYRWNADRGGGLTVVFQNDRLVSKAQIRLK